MKQKIPSVCRFNRSRKFYPISRLNNFFPTLNNLLKKGNIQIYKPSCLILSKNLHLMKNSFLILIKFNLHSNPKTIPRSSLSEKKILQKTLLSTKSLSLLSVKNASIWKNISRVSHSSSRQFFPFFSLRHFIRPRERIKSR